MYSDETFNRIIHIVEQETGIDRSDLLSTHKSTEVVDATYILVRLLRGAGFYPAQIAARLRRTDRSVNVIMTQFGARVKLCPIARINYERARKRIMDSGIPLL